MMFHISASLRALDPWCSIANSERMRLSLSFQQQYYQGNLWSGFQLVRFARWTIFIYWVAKETGKRAQNTTSNLSRSKSIGFIEIKLLRREAAARNRLSESSAWNQRACLFFATEMCMCALRCEGPMNSLNTFFTLWCWKSTSSSAKSDFSASILINLFAIWNRKDKTADWEWLA